MRKVRCFKEVSFEAQSRKLEVDEYRVTKLRIKEYYPVVLLASLAVTVPHPLYPYFFAHDLHMDSTQYGGLTGLAQFAHFLAALIYGLLSDRCGRRRLLIWQGVLAAVLYGLFGAALVCFDHSTNFFRFTVCSLYVSLAAATTTMVLSTSVVFDWCKSTTSGVHEKLAQERPKFVGHLFGVCGVATVIGPVAGQLVQLAAPSNAGTASALFLASSFAFLGALVCLCFCHESSTAWSGINSEDEEVETVASAEGEKIELSTKERPHCVVPTQSPPWLDLNLLFLCQFLKSLSTCSFTVCYALVLEAYLPAHWFYGWNTETTLALIISITSVVRVLLQLKYFQAILELVGGPGPAYLIGSVGLCLGQCGLFWSLKYVPLWLDMLGEGPNGHAQTICFTAIHVGLVASAITGGLSLIEPAITSLVGMSMNLFPHIQGLAQGMNSASNLLGASIGPLLFGWLLNLRSSSVLHEARTADDDLSNIIVPMMDTVFDDFQPLDPYLLRDKNPDENQVGFAELYKGTLTAASHRDVLLSEARPGATFYLAAALAFTPLLLTRRILKINQQWKPPSISAPCTN